MKIIVRSTHPERGLLNADNQFVPGHRPAVAKVTQLLEGRIAKGDFRLIVGNLSDEATDDEFVKYLNDSESEDLAITSFEAAFSVEESRKTEDETKEVKTPKVKAEAKAKA